MGTTHHTPHTTHHTPQNTHHTPHTTLPTHSLYTAFPFRSPKPTPHPHTPHTIPHNQLLPRWIAQVSPASPALTRASSRRPARWSSSRCRPRPTLRRAPV